MWSLKKALLLTFLVVVAIPLALFMMWPHSQAFQNEVRHVQDKHLLLARNLGSALERYARDVTATFDYLAGSLLSGHTIEPPGELLRSLRFRHICMIDIDTRQIVVALSGSLQVGNGKLPADKLERLLQLATSHPGLPAPAVASEGGNAEMMLARVSGNKLVFGVIDTEYFRQLGKSISFGKNGHAVIVDTKGQAIAHPMPAFESRVADLSKVSAVQRILRGESGVDVFYSPAYKEDMIAGFAAVPHIGWGVMVPQPLSELRAQASGVKNSALSIFSLGLLLAALVALRFSWLVLAPLQNVIRAAERMANGERDVQIDVPGRLVPLELVKLASTFNAMASNVQSARQSEIEARAKAEDANRQKTECVRFVTHELRSPINAVLGFADVLAERSNLHAEEQAAIVRQIQGSGRHLLSLVNDLLDLGRMEAGRYELDKTVLGVDEIAERCLATVADAARAQATTLAFQSDGEPPALLADERAMYQVLLNLVTNALRYGRPGGSVTIAAGTSEDGGAEIRVIDDGPGIAAQDLERVMLPFERAARPGDAPGTGLGLPIVKRLVELHGGSFALASAVGVGTVALIKLPVSAVNRAEPDMTTLRAAA